MAPGDAAKTVVADATVVIHLANAGRLDLLGAIDGWTFVVPDQVVAEVRYPDQAAALARAIDSGHVRRESSTDAGEIALFADLRQRMGRGEGACLAMAETRGWMLASDDRGRAFRRMARQRIGSRRLIDTARIVEIASEQRVISADEKTRIEEVARG